MSDLSQRLQVALAGRYRIERTLGRGGMATVFLAEDLKHRRRVALKVLDPEVAAAIGPERFLREIETIARLSHPHILPLFDSGLAGGLLFYVMPFVEGESLRQRLSREKQLSMEEALRIARDVTDALSYAHSRGIVHRDIKPENILLESGHAIVADFGIARVIAAAGAEALTRTGLVLGTPVYMSPEQAAGDHDLDGRSDLYSLGCVLYEMLAGVPPFSGSTAESLAYQHQNVTPRSVTELRPAVPAGVAAALQRALAKLPADRFYPVALFSEALAERAVTPATATVPTPAVALPPPGRRLALVGLATLMVVASVALTLWVTLGRRRTAPVPAAPAKHDRAEIAVLPFLNLSAGGPHAYFASGLHDELLTQLAQVAALKVISRTSVMGYAGTTKPLKQIAAELGVGSVVEGSVQVEGRRLRVDIQLIDAATDKHVWAQQYDRTLDDAFAIQSDVAQRVAAAVGAALTRAEQERLSAAPTANGEAYRLFLEGLDYFFRPGLLRQDREIAQRFFEQAIALDPRFADAHARLSAVHGQMYWLRMDPSPARAALQFKEAEIALRLAPHQPSVHKVMAMAQYYARRDYRGALHELTIALKGQPDDGETLAYLGYVNRRLGNWDEALRWLKKSMQYAPGNADLWRGIGQTYEIVRRYPEAVRAYDRAFRLAPDVEEIDLRRGWAYVEWRGRLDTLAAVLGRAPTPGPVAARAMLLLWERDASGLLRELQRAPVAVFDEQEAFQPTALFAGWAHQLRGEPVAAHAAFDAARVILDSTVKSLPDDWRVHAARGLALAGLGRRGEALREARWLQGSIVYRKDAYMGPRVAEARAQLLAQAGAPEAALEEVERLLRGPSVVSVHSLRLDPRWDPIREYPRFKALLVKYANPEEAAR